MKSRYYRHLHRIEKFQQMGSGRPSINTELMLHAQNVGALFIQAPRCGHIGFRIMLIDLNSHS